MPDEFNKTPRRPSQEVTAYNIPAYTTPPLLDHAPKSIPLGSMLGKYQIVAVLGKGGGGAVYAAEDTLIKREVAIKMLPPEMANDPALLIRFKAEAQAAGKLNHPHVVTIYEIMEHEGVHAIVMELAQGGSMQDYLERKGSPGWRASTRLAGEACKALMVAHEAGLVHRDIKPANLLLSKDGHVKVADFGLAKMDSRENAMQTQAGAILGTPAFMSPEQCRGDKIDHRTDIYSLGCTYFAMLTGKPPFEAASSIQVMFSHCSAPIPNPCELNAETPASCADVLRKALAKDPSERYASAKEMFNDLRAIVGAAAGSTMMQTSHISVMDQPAIAPPPSWEQLKPKPVKGGINKWVIIGSAAAVFAAVAIPGGIMLAGRNSSTQAPSEVKPSVAVRPEVEAPGNPAGQPAKLPVTVPAAPATLTPVVTTPPAVIPAATRPAAAPPVQAVVPAQVAPQKVATAVVPAVPSVAVPTPAPPVMPPSKTVSTPQTQSPVAAVKTVFDANRLKALPAKISNSLHQDLILIHPGKFTMGEEGLADAPPHEVTITQPYYMGVLEVSQADFLEVLGGEAPEGMRHRDLAAPFVSWSQAAEFCRQLSDLPAEKAAKRTYRLPTEAEWEYACRAGTTTRYAYGKVLNKHEANFGKKGELALVKPGEGEGPPEPPPRPEPRTPPARGGRPGPGQRPGQGQGEGPGPGGQNQAQRPEHPLEPLGFYPANTWGLKDMHGGVWEWCSDFYSASAYKDGPAVDPEGPPKGEYHVARGGCWMSPAEQCTSSYRNGKPEPTNQYPNFGFRIVCDVPVDGK